MADVRSQLGKYPTGKIKNKCCWTYIKNGKCSHFSDFLEASDNETARLYHPARNECKYLRSKNNIKNN